MRKTWLYYFGVFLGSFLLFQIQPMISKAILPEFGGSYLVWAVCVTFFQAVLLLGYFYSHFMQRWLGMYKYARWHWILLLLPFIVFPFRFDNLSSFVQNKSLIITIPWILIVNVGLPFLILSTVSIIFQCWFYMSDLPGRDNPYVLYGASNAGSLLALLTYPVIFEPLFNLKQQGYLWWAGYCVLFVLHIFCMPKSNNRGEKETIKDVSAVKVTTKDVWGWFFLSAAGCFSLLAVTNLITFDIASVPLLWVLPLSIYLLTFVLTFKRNSWYPRWIKTALFWAVSVGVVIYLMSLLRLGLPYLFILFVHLSILFIICLNCHGRLNQIKPVNVKNLTAFYLIISIGGFFGSFFVSTVIPLISNSLIEYPGSFFLVYFAMAISYGFKNKITKFKALPVVVYMILAGLSLTLLPWILNNFLNLSARVIFVFIAIILVLIFTCVNRKPWAISFVLLAIILTSQWTEELSMGSSIVAKIRNFYGIYRVYNINNKRYVQHGTTLHGSQYLKSNANIPLSYYHPTTPVGKLLLENPFNFKNIGMVGLGTGALAAYFGVDQTLTVYELDPDNLKIAENYFTYLNISKKKGVEIKFIFGDGRVLLRQAEKNSYDLLIIDAFNSGSIPVHLLTVEAIKEYFRVLKQEGLLLVHISNRVVNLKPIIYSAASELGLYACDNDNSGQVDPDADFTSWMAIYKDKQNFFLLHKRFRWVSRQDEKAMIKHPWTDQYINLFSILF